MKRTYNIPELTDLQKERCIEIEFFINIQVLKKIGLEISKIEEFLNALAETSEEPIDMYNIQTVLYGITVPPYLPSHKEVAIFGAYGKVPIRKIHTIVKGNYYSLIEEFSQVGDIFGTFVPKYEKNVLEDIKKMNKVIEKLTKGLVCKKEGD